MFEKMPAYLNQDNQRLEKQQIILDKINKAVKIFVATGVLTMGSQPMLENKIIEGCSAQSYIEYSGEDNEVQQEKIREGLEYLEGKYSKSIVSFLSVADEEAKDKKNSVNQSPEIVGFDKLNISDYDLKNLWSEEFYPKGTINGEISEIKYLDKSHSNVEDYNIKGEKGAGTTRKDKSVEFTKADNYGNKSETLRALDWYFSHETGHLNDWSSKINLTSAERVQFLIDVTNSFEKEGSFRDVMGYIDSINNPIKHKELYYKVSEYWATLCEYYLSFSDSNKILSEEEINLLKKWLLQDENSLFNIEESIEKRSSLITEISK